MSERSTLPPSPAHAGQRRRSPPSSPSRASELPPAKRQQVDMEDVEVRANHSQLAIHVYLRIFADMNTLETRAHNY